MPDASGRRSVVRGVGHRDVSAVQLAARLQSALQELQQVGAYEYVVVNDDLERAVASVGSIIDAEAVSRARVKNLRQQVGLLIERLEMEIENTTP